MHSKKNVQKLLHQRVESVNGAKLIELRATLSAVYLGKLPGAVFVASTSGLFLPKRHKRSKTRL